MFVGLFYYVLLPKKAEGWAGVPGSTMWMLQLAKTPRGTFTTAAKANCNWEGKHFCWEVRAWLMLMRECSWWEMSGCRWEEEESYSIRHKKCQKRSRNCAQKIFAESHMLKTGQPSCLDELINTSKFTEVLRAFQVSIERVGETRP